MLMMRDEGIETGPSVPPNPFVSALPAQEHAHDFPGDAVFHVWRKHIGGGQFPISAGTIQAHEALKRERTLLVCFDRTGPHQWGKMKFALREAQDLRVPTFFIVGDGISSDTTAAFLHLNELACMHGLDDHLHNAQLAFVPSAQLARFLGITRDEGGIKNALVLFSHGHVAVSWVAQHHDDRFKWRDIRLALL